MVLTGYGYFHVLSRRDILIRKMKVEVRSIGQTLRVPLEKISIPKEMEYVQELIDAVEEYERTLGVVVYHGGRDLVFRSRSIGDAFDPYVEKIKKAMEENLSQESFEVYHKTPVFSYAFPLKDRRGRSIGGVCVLQHTSFMEEEIRKAKWSILLTLLILVGGIMALILVMTKHWISKPISRLMQGIQELGKGNLDFQIDLQGKDEPSQLAQAFNQMASDLRKAQEKIIREANTRLGLEESLRRSEKLAIIGQLASGLAHEIGTPLNIISGRAELTMKKVKGQKEAEKNLEIISLQSEKISKIIRQLLGFVRKKPPEKRRLNLSALLETTLEFLDPQIQRQKIQLSKEVKSPLPWVMGDPDQLQQVFSNLIVNAIQSMPEGGELRISVGVEETSKKGLEDEPWDYLIVHIEDTGVGMDQETLENIFNPFFTTKDTGTGLGLMVSQGILQDHEGWIEAESEKGKGSSFKVYLPAIREEVRHEG